MFGNVDLMHSLAGIANLSAAPASDKGFASAAKRLPKEAKAEYKAIEDRLKSEIDAFEERQKEALEKLKEKQRAARKDFFRAFPQARYLSPAELKKAREVVSAFLLGKEAGSEDMKTDGLSLVVDGAEVARRNSISDRFITVCPGEFGGKGRAERRAANAILEMVGAGVQVYDRDGASFFGPHGSKSGRVVSSACHQVEVGKKLRDRAMQEIYGPAIGPVRQESRASLDTGEGIQLNPLEARAIDLEAEGVAMREGNLKRYGRKLRGRKAYRAKKAAAAAEARKAAKKPAKKKASKKKAKK
jgi:hypothetical protein